jgi:hypothetical protein
MAGQSEQRNRLAEPRFSDFHAAWHFLAEHPMYLSEAPHWVELDGTLAQIGRTKRVLVKHNLFPGAGTLDIEVVRVNPATERIEDDEELNTATRVWLESGPWYWTAEMKDEERELFGSYGMPSHDVRLNCGAETFEAAVIELANLVFRYYGAKGRKGRG